MKMFHIYEEKKFSIQKITRLSKNRISIALLLRNLTEFSEFKLSYAKGIYFFNKVMISEYPLNEFLPPLF